MAISAAFVWEVRTDGSDDNAGGFKAGATGTDRSQQAAAHVTIDGATITAVVHTTTTQLNVTGYTVAAADVGNCVNVNGGTATAGRYEITAVDTGNNRWTLDRAVGTAAQTATGRMGGALATPGKLGKIYSTSGQGATGQHSWIKAGTYTLSTATADSGGPFLNSTCTGFVEGYSITRGDRAARPVLNAGAITGVVLWRQSYGNYGTFICLEADGNSGTNNAGFQCGYGQAYVCLCKASNCVSSGQYGFNFGSIIRCQAVNCYYGFYTTNPTLCHAKSCIRYGFHNSSIMECCIASGGTDAAGAGIYAVAGGTYARNCISYGNAGDGIIVPGNASVFQCISVGNVGVGKTGFYNGYATAVIHCAGYNNTSMFNPPYTEAGVAVSGPYLTIDAFITLTADPFVDAANDDFRLNDTAGGGAVLRAAGWPVFGQTDAHDIGPVQTAGGSSGGSRLVGPSGLVGRSY